MSSGESDAIRIPVTQTFMSDSSGPTKYSYTTYNPATTTAWPNTNTITFGGSHYYYQIRCPKCKTFNWAELDLVLVCKGILKQERTPGGKVTYCQASLKAVSDKVDYEIPVER